MKAKNGSLGERYTEWKSSIWLRFRRNGTRIGKVQRGGGLEGGELKKTMKEM